MKSKVVIHGDPSFEIRVLEKTFNNAFGSVSKSIRFEFAQACERLFSNRDYRIVITRDKCKCFLCGPDDDCFVTLILEK